MTAPCGCSKRCVRNPTASRGTTCTGRWPRVAGGGDWCGQRAQFTYRLDRPSGGEGRLEDRHELLNSFVWGPDGHLYVTNQ